jgi:hypothetical protein
MHEDREHRVDDDSAHHPDSDTPDPQQAPLIRLLANPRRVRRA